MNEIRQRKPKVNCNPRTVAFGIGLLSIGFLLPVHSQHSHSGTGCDSYDVDVATELALLAGPIENLVAAGAADVDVPSIEPARPYRLRLAPQADVNFAAPPGRRMLDDDAFAGFARFSVGAAGTWRIALDHNSWVDVVAPGGTLVESTRFGGRAECAALRKMVEFPLQPDIEYTLQLSGGTEATTVVLISGPVATDR